MTAPTTTTTAPPPRQLTAADIAALLALVQAQAAVRQRITDTAVQAALQLLQAFSGWWSDTEVGAVMNQVVRLVQPAQRQAATLTDAYLTRAASLMLNRRLTPAGPIDVTKLRADMTREVAKALTDGRIKPVRIVLGDTENGPSDHINAPAPMVLRPAVSDRSLRRVPGRDSAMPAAPARRYVSPVTPYERIAEQYRYQVVAQGVPEEKAKQKALLKLAIVAETDVTLAVREQYHKTMGKHKADGYRRVLHPELSKTGPCGLCVVAANRVYKVADLLPLHNRCVCEVLPIYAGMDPGINLNASDLQALYGTAAGKPGQMSTAAKNLKRVRVDTGTQRIGGQETRRRAELDQLERAYETLVHRALRGENVARSMNAQAARITAIRDELGFEPSTVAPRTATPPPTRNTSPMKKKTRVVLTENAETGPVLIDGDQNYRGPVDVAKAKSPDDRVRGRAALDSLETYFEVLQRKVNSGQDLGKTLSWTTNRISALRRELGLPVG